MAVCAQALLQLILAAQLVSKDMIKLSGHKICACQRLLASYATIHALPHNVQQHCLPTCLLFTLRCVLVSSSASRLCSPPALVLKRTVPWRLCITDTLPQ